MVDFLPAGVVSEIPFRKHVVAVKLSPVLQVPDRIRVKPAASHPIKGYLLHRNGGDRESQAPSIDPLKRFLKAIEAIGCGYGMLVLVEDRRKLCMCPGRRDLPQALPKPYVVREQPVVRLRFVPVR